MQLRAVVRGKFRQLTTAGGGAVEATLYNCVVEKPPFDRGGKSYATLDLSDAVGDVDAVRKVDAFIRGAAHPAYSPFQASGPRETLVIKVPRTGVAWELADGATSLDGPYELHEGQRVDVVLAAGAFGGFGYCWLLRRIKPSI